MADPFQDVDAAGGDFISAFADSMDERQADPTMEKIVSTYLGKLAFPEDSLTIEVGCGAATVAEYCSAVHNIKPSSQSLRLCLLCYPTFCH